MLHDNVALGAGQLPRFHRLARCHRLSGIWPDRVIAAVDWFR
jgi:hypothetical protein